MVQGLDDTLLPAMIPLSTAYELSCGHYVDRASLIQHLYEPMNGIANVFCPCGKSECPKLIAYHDWASLILVGPQPTDEVLSSRRSQVQQLIEKRFAEKQGYRPCARNLGTGRACDCLISVNNPPAACPSCQQDFCKDCSFPVHEPVACDFVLSWRVHVLENLRLWRGNINVIPVRQRLVQVTDGGPGTGDVPAAPAPQHPRVAPRRRARGYVSERVNPRVVPLADQIASQDGLSHDDVEFLSWVKMNAQICPNCRTAIEKSMYCDHIRCRNCGADFCYACGVLDAQLVFVG